MATEVTSDGSCKRSTPKSRSTYPKASPQELRRPRFSFCLYLSNSVASEKQPRLPTKSAAKPNVPVKRSRAAPPAAAPSRWPLYRSTLLRVSTTQMKVFRQDRIFLSGSRFPGVLPVFFAFRPRDRAAQKKPARKQPHFFLTSRAARAGVSSGSARD